MLYVLLCSVIYLIFAIIGVILIVREVKKNDNKEDMTLIIISFLVPLIGLIVYAVNVGKDKHITECTLKGLKMYLKFLVVQFIISVITILLMVVVFNANIEHHTSTRVNSATATKKELNSQEIEKKIQTNSYVNRAYVKVSGKIIYIDIEFVGDTSIELAKSIAEDTIYNFDNNYREEYDFNFSVTLKDNLVNFQGYKSYKTNNVIWND